MSIEQLEILLLMQHAHARDWSPAEINEQLRSQEGSIVKWLETLMTLNLVRSNGGRYQFAPASDEVRQQIAALADAYRSRRIKVIEFIFSKPNEALLSFARAFELRKRS